MRLFLEYLFNKPDKYALVWAFILSKVKNKSCDIDKRIIMTRFKLNRTTFNRILDYGVQFKGDISLNIKCSRNLLTVNLKGLVREQKKNELNISVNPIIEEVINYLNVILQRNGKRGIKTNNKSATTYINKRLKDGHDLNEFKDVMLAQEKWLKDPKMHTYYRPSTLFSGKFEEYLNNINKPDEPIKENRQQNKLFNALREAQSDGF